MRKQPIESDSLGSKPPERNRDRETKKTERRLQYLGQTKAATRARSRPPVGSATHVALPESCCIHLSCPFHSTLLFNPVNVWRLIGGALTKGITGRQIMGFCELSTSPQSESHTTHRIGKRTARVQLTPTEPPNTWTIMESGITWMTLGVNLTQQMVCYREPSA